MAIIWYFILALIQAATEFLPVSSSGHLLFMKGILGGEQIPVIFDIVVHTGSLLAILIFYRDKLVNTFKGAREENQQKLLSGPNCRFIGYIAISTLITFGIYLIFKDPIERLYQSPAILWTTYIVTTLLLFSTGLLKKNKTVPIAQKGVLLPIIAGFFQGVAIFPGVSRSGATISSLLWFRVKREEAAYYSFFLAIPAILGALIFKLADLENLAFLVENSWVILSSFFVSTLFSYLFLKLLVFVIRRGHLWYFGIYTMMLAVVSFILF